jgi:hypothetical protein
MTMPTIGAGRIKARRYWAKRDFIFRRAPGALMPQLAFEFG